MKKHLFNHWPILVILVSSLLIVWPIFLPGYFSHHDDLQVMRVFEMRKCLLDFQIPCRWVPDMGFGNGFPLFNFYGVLPYYIGAILSFFLGFIGAAKTLFFIPLVLGGISMYLLAREVGDKWTGLTAAILYLFAPYRSLDAYVRGAVSESFALSIIPLVFYFGLRLSKNKTKFNFLSLAFSLGAFLTTHNIMTMLFAPLLFLFSFYVTVFSHSKNIRMFMLSIILGVGLSAFFLFPAFLEKSLVQTDTLTRFDLDFRVHFVTIRQLFFNRNWGYGASILGPNDTISFQIGWPHWWLVIVASIIFLIKKKFLPLFFVGIFLISVFMTHNRSAFIWERIGILRFTQFPWRFLSVAIFSASLIGGSVLLFVKEKLKKWLAFLIIISTIILNFNYFKPEKFYFNLTDKQKLSGELWDQQRRAGILDYLPRGAYEPREAAPNKPLIIEGKADIKEFINRSNSWQFEINVKEAAKIEMPVFDFPNWEVISNGQKISHNKENLLKRIQFNLNPGDYRVTGKLRDTSTRIFSNLLTLLSFLALLFFVYYDKRLKKI